MCKIVTYNDTGTRQVNWVGIIPAKHTLRKCLALEFSRVKWLQPFFFNTLKTSVSDPSHFDVDPDPDPDPDPGIHIW